MWWLVLAPTVVAFFGVLFVLLDMLPSSGDERIKIERAGASIYSFAAELSIDGIPEDFSADAYVALSYTWCGRDVPFYPILPEDDVKEYLQEGVDWDEFWKKCNLRDPTDEESKAFPAIQTVADLVRVAYFYRKETAESLNVGRERQG